ncbi:hypothetical protein BSKO_12932 [Bryopsis sp. KO-2023]|nr:hypothetical protein BSKO_12932 [Bryopsis sp. KO-2023]
MSWLCPDAFWDTVGTFWEDKAKEYGPVMSGMLFGCGWWMWMDAVLVNGKDHHIPAVQFFPGIIATLAVIVMSCISREDVREYDPFDDDAMCRSRFWLLISYILSLGAVVGGVWMLVQDYATKDGVDIWPGVAGLCQVFMVLASGLVFFLSRTSSDSGGSIF